MANWPTSPDWIDPSTINLGNEYSVSDGVTYEDFNKIVNNIIYLKNKGVSIPQEKSIAIISNGTQTVTPDEGHSLAKVTIVTNVPSQEPTGTLKIIRNDVYDISNYKYVNVAVAQSTSRPTLHAPTILLSGTTLRITNPSSNGSYVGTYLVYVDGAYLSTELSTSVNLANYAIAEGTHSITVKCAATNFNDSPASNAVTYKVLYTYTITTALSHVTADSTNPKTIKENASTTLIFTAASGYKLPETVTVTGCTYTWEQSTGMLDISNPTGNVAISISAIAVYSISTTLTGCVGANSNPTTIEQGGTATLTFTANDRYALPDTVTVSGATYTWDKSTGVLTLSDATGNVSITIVATKSLPQLATPQNVTIDGTTLSWDEVENATSYDIYADGTLIGNTTGGGVTGETWLLNDSFQRITKLFYCFDSTYEPDTAIIAFTVDFSSNGQQFTKLVGSRMGPNPSIDTTKAVQVMGIWADAWKDEAYRTITLSEPASGDFLTWLQSNTIKQ